MNSTEPVNIIHNQGESLIMNNIAAMNNIATRKQDGSFNGYIKEVDKV